MTEIHTPTGYEGFTDDQVDAALELAYRRRDHLATLVIRPVDATEAVADDIARLEAEVERRYDWEPADLTGALHDALDRGLDAAARWRGYAETQVREWDPDDVHSTLQLDERLATYGMLAARATVGDHEDVSVYVHFFASQVVVEVDVHDEYGRQPFDRWFLAHHPDTQATVDEITHDLMDEAHDRACHELGL